VRPQRARGGRGRLADVVQRLGSVRLERRRRRQLARRGPRRARRQGTTASFLVSEDSFADFDLELEFWVDPEANSGVFLRCQDPGTITDTSCYEANIFDTRPDQTYRTGSIVNVAEPAEFVYTGGQWNRIEITADGHRLQVTLNGRPMVDTEDSRLLERPDCASVRGGYGHVPERQDPGADLRTSCSSAAR
jgi:hypothetical protein